jgi:hypothetical protein
MLRKTLTLALAAILLQTSLVITIPAVPRNEKDAVLAERIRADVMRLGRQTRVHVKLKDDTVLEGNISEITAEYFVITEARSNTSATINYQQVKQVKKNGLSKGAKIGIGVAIAVAVGIIIAVVAGRNRNSNNNEPSCVRTAQVGVPCPPGCVCITQ